MMGRLVRIVVVLYLVASLGVGFPALAQNPNPQQQQAPSQSSAPPTAAQNPETPYTSTLFSRDYTKGKHWFPNIFAPYTSMKVPMPDLTNSPSIYGFIHDGKLELSLQDAIGLALRNDLNIAVEEYVPWIDETNLLAAKGGGSLPSAQITQIGQVGGGTFDPVISESTSITDQKTSTVLNPLSSGVSTSSQSVSSSTHTTQVDLSYTQELHSGTLLGVQLDNTRSSTSPSDNVFNPSVTSTLAASIQQPLLNGWGFLPHTQFILEAENQDKIGVLQFEETVIQEVTNVETTYWNLVAYVQAVDAEKAGLAAFQTLYEQDQHMLQIGTGTPSDAVFSQSEVVETNQTLLGYEASERVQAAALLQYITKNPSDPRLQGLEIVPTSLPEDNPQHSNLSLQDAIKEAWADRPELKVDQLTANNYEIIVRTTKNALLPTLDVTGTYESTGLSGNAAGAFTPNGTFSPSTGEPIVDANGNPVTQNGVPLFIGVANGVTGATIPSGIHSVYSQIFQNTSPTYEGSLTFSVPLRNRVAQASAAQAKLNNREEVALRQQQSNSIYSAVDEDLTQVDIYADEVAAAVQATQLLQQSYEYQKEKFNLAQSTTEQVVYYEQQVVGAQLNEVFAKNSYKVARANLDMALGRTLTANNITVASNGKDDPLMNVGGTAPLIPGTIGKRLAVEDVFDLDHHH